LFSKQLVLEIGDAGDVTARPVKTGDETFFTGSSPMKKTMGMVAVALFAALTAGVPPAKITTT
jgi:hypothetical protein